MQSNDHGNITEKGGIATFTVKLKSQPNGQVVIDSTSSDESEGLMTPVSLTFSGENYHVARTVTVTDMGDLWDDGNQSYTFFLTLNLDLTTDTTGYADQKYR